MKTFMEVTQHREGLVSLISSFRFIFEGKEEGKKQEWDEGDGRDREGEGRGKRRGKEKGKERKNRGRSWSRKERKSALLRK